MAGRPSKYSAELVDKICELTATTNRSLQSICADLDVSPRTVLEWLADSSKEEFTHPFFLLLNLAVGGQLPGPVAPETVFPATMKVDYVRVYSRESEKGIESNVIRLKRK